MRVFSGVCFRTFGDKILKRLNLQLVPHAGALPNCAMPRLFDFIEVFIFSIDSNVPFAKTRAKKN